MKKSWKFIVYPLVMALINLLLIKIIFSNFISDIDMGFKTKVSNYGLNSLLLELYLKINVNNSIMSPSSYKEFGETYEIILASKVVVGEIPVYYGGELEKTSPIVSS